MRRVKLALAGATGLFAALIFWLSSGEGSAMGWGALSAFLAVLAIGLPLLYHWCRRGCWEAWRFVLFGAAAGLVCALPFYGGRHLFGFLLLIFVASGAVGGALFWVAAIWRNRDLTYPKAIYLPCGTLYRVARHALRVSRNSASPRKSGSRTSRW